MILNDEVKKPVKPKKPKHLKLKPPGNVCTVYGYAYENLKTCEVKFFDKDMLEKESKEFFAEWLPIRSTTHSLIAAFAAHENVNIQDVLIIPYTDLKEEHCLEYRAIKFIDKEEFKARRKLYDLELKKQKKEMDEYRIAMKEYQQEKSTYDIWKLKQALKEDK